mgnify:CR=1 FL=1
MTAKKEQFSLELDQAQVLQVTTKKGSGLDREYKLVLVTPESSVLQLGAFDQESLFEVVVRVKA